jgi:phosphohistidine phosphatase
MKTLLIMRHAKSSWKHPELADRDRPLNKRGEKDAPHMGKVLKHADILPQLIYTSTAVRSSKTAETVAEKIGYKKEIIYKDALYMAEPLQIVDVLRETPDEIKRVMIVGHNPGMEGLAQMLSRKVETLGTSAIACIKLPIEHWSDLNLEVEGKLVKVWEPKEK